MPVSLLQLNVKVLWNGYEGNFDPVTYCAETLAIPSSLKAVFSPTFAEPIKWLILDENDRGILVIRMHSHTISRDKNCAG